MSRVLFEGINYTEHVIRAVQEMLQSLGVTESILKKWKIAEVGHLAPPELLAITHPTRLDLPLLANLEHLRVVSF